MSQGYVYILTNPAMPDLVKIGMTTRSVEQRAEELFTSGVPHRFDVFHSAESPDCVELERQAHFYMKQFRCNDSREFFKIQPDDARQIIDRLLIEQVKEIVSTYAECHVLVEHHMALEAADMSLLSQGCNRTEYEIASAIGMLTVEDMLPLLQRMDKRREEKKATRANLEVVTSGVSK